MPDLHMHVDRKRITTLPKRQAGFGRIMESEGTHFPGGAFYMLTGDMVHIIATEGFAKEHLGNPEDVAVGKVLDHPDTSVRVYAVR